MAKTDSVDSMKFIDSHCHLHDARIADQLPVLLEQAKAFDVDSMASCATMEENFGLTFRLSQKFDSIIPFFGIHPWFVKSRSAQWKDILEKHLLLCPSGVGETGLDFTNKTWDREEQIRVFKHHLQLAMEMGRPINIHIRKAWDALVQILKKTGKLPVAGMVHSYSGSADFIPVLEKYNLYISFSGSVTNPSAKKVVNALKKVSEDRFVLETDTPDIYPWLDNSGPPGLNEPKNLPAIAQIASRRIGKDKDIFVSQAYKNSKKLFYPLLKGKKEI